jgi:hypothetical protein
LKKIEVDLRFNPDSALELCLWFDKLTMTGHPELVEGKKQRWKILLRNLGLKGATY